MYSCCDGGEDSVASLEPPTVRLSTERPKNVGYN